MFRKENIGDSSGGVSSATCIKGGLREKVIEAGREPLPFSRGRKLLTGDISGGGDGVSGVGDSAGVTLVEDLLLLRPDSPSLGAPKAEINDKTRVDARRVNNIVLAVPDATESINLPRERPMTSEVDDHRDVLRSRHQPVQGQLWDAWSVLVWR